MSHRSSRSIALSLIVLSTTVFADARQSTTLPLNKTDAGMATAEKPAIYDFKAATAGVLSVAVHGDGDLALTIVDEDGQPLPDGSTDRDLYGAGGAEQLMVTITEPGVYRLQVKVLDGAGKFQIGAAWIAMPARARPSDPDKRPATAKPIEAGRSYEDSLDTGAGDSWDWFVLTPKINGTLTAVLRPLGDSKVDLQLEIYLTDDFNTPAVRADNDSQGHPANESGTVDVKAGQKLFIKVAAASSGTAGKYRLSSSLIQ